MAEVEAGTAVRGAPAGRAGVAALGGVLGAVVASSCCLLPVVLVSLGATGAWIGALAGLAPYQPYIAGATVVLLGYGYWLVHRRRRAACAADGACTRPARPMLVTVALLSATVLTAVALAFPYAAPFILG